MKLKRRCDQGAGMESIENDQPCKRAVRVLTNSLYWDPQVTMFDHFADQGQRWRLGTAVEGGSRREILAYKTVNAKL